MPMSLLLDRFIISVDVVCHNLQRQTADNASFRSPPVPFQAPVSPHFSLLAVISGTWRSAISIISLFCHPPPLPSSQAFQIFEALPLLVDYQEVQHCKRSHTIIPQRKSIFSTWPATKPTAPIGPLNQVRKLAARLHRRSFSARFAPKEPKSKILPIFGTVP